MVTVASAKDRRKPVLGEGSVVEDIEVVCIVGGLLGAEGGVTWIRRSPR
jgi:hypothetical protein